MRTLNILLRGIILVFCCITMVACHKDAPNTLIVGTLSGPETELMDVAQKVALEKYGLTIKIVEFNDYNLPNMALNDGALDANVYQHLPYLNAAIQAHHYEFSVIGKTFLYPTGLYSSKIKSLRNLPPKATIAIPNDPSNEIRALLLLDEAGLIKLNNNATPSVHDILANPKQLQLKEIDASQLPHVLADVDAAVINTTFALPAGLSLHKDTLWVESKHSPYANLIVIRTDTRKKEMLQLLVQALQSPEVVAKARVLFGDSAIPAW